MEFPHKTWKPVFGHLCTNRKWMLLQISGSAFEIIFLQLLILVNVHLQPVLVNVNH